MSVPVRFDHLAHAGVVVANVTGDIDIANAAEFEEVLLDAVPNNSDGLVIDLAEVRYVDSAGVRMIFGVARHLEVSRQSLGISVPESSPVQRLLKITNVGEVATLCATVEECIDGVRNKV